MLSNFVLVSAIHQHKSAIGTHMFPPEPPPISLTTPPHEVVTKHWVELPVSHSKFLPAICFTYGNVHASMFFSQFVPLSPSNVSASLFSMFASPYIRSVSSYSPIILRKIKYSYFHLRKLGQKMCT